jgi:hypothetical protein
MVLKFLVCSVDEKTKYKNIAGFCKTIFILKCIPKAPSELFLSGVLTLSLVDFIRCLPLIGCKISQHRAIYRVTGDFLNATIISLKRFPERILKLVSVSTEASKHYGFLNNKDT